MHTHTYTYTYMNAHTYIHAHIQAYWEHAKKRPDHAASADAEEYTSVCVRPPQ